MGGQSGWTFRLRSVPTLPPLVDTWGIAPRPDVGVEVLPPTTADVHHRRVTGPDHARPTTDATLRHATVAVPLHTIAADRRPPITLAVLLHHTIQDTRGSLLGWESPVKLRHM